MKVMFPILSAIMVALISSPASACMMAPPPIFFGIGSAQADARASVAAEAITMRYRQEPDLVGRIGLIGHADRSGNREANMRLSRARAMTVRDLLVAGGVPASRIEILGAGDQAAREDTYAYDPASHRRVEIVWIRSEAGWDAVRAEREAMTAAGIPIPSC